MKVSVVMPVYNGASHLDESLASLLAEDFAFELVIVDDGSTDETPAKLRAWCERDARIRLITFEKNRGLAAALKRGVDEAHGDYIARHDGDEIYVRGRIPAQVELLDRERDVVLVSTWFDIIDEHGRRTGTHRPLFSSEEIHSLLNFYNVLGGHAQVLYRRDAAVRVGGYREEFSTVEDYDLWRRLRNAGRIVVLPRVGLLRRHHSAGVSFAQHSRQRALSRQVMCLALGETLQREITDVEANAIATLWRGEYHAGVAKIAIALSREAASPSMRNVLAKRFFFAAARALRRGFMRDAITWLAAAIRTAGFL